MAADRAGCGLHMHVLRDRKAPEEGQCSHAVEARAGLTKRLWARIRLVNTRSVLRKLLKVMI